MVKGMRNVEEYLHFMEEKAVAKGKFSKECLYLYSESKDYATRDFWKINILIHNLLNIEFEHQELHSKRGSRLTPMKIV